MIYHQGDCLDLLHKIDKKSVKLVLTSPPYNLGKSYEQRVDLDDYVKQEEKIISKCISKLSNNGSICWQVGNYVEDGHIIPLDVLLYPIFAKHRDLKLRNRIIWYFGHGLHATKRFSGRYEVILWFTKGDDYVFNLDAVRVPQKYPNKKSFRGPKKGEYSSNPLGKNPTDVWEIPNVKANHPEKTVHPCQFPIELAERLVLALTNERDWVLDPFMGVGSTAIASVLHGRRVMGAEIKKEYVDIGLTRLKEISEGKLRTRPMWRPIFEPPSKTKDKQWQIKTFDEVLQA